MYFAVNDAAYRTPGSRKRPGKMAVFDENDADPRRTRRRRYCVPPPPPVRRITRVHTVRTVTCLTGRPTAGTDVGRLSARTESEISYPFDGRQANAGIVPDACVSFADGRVVSDRESVRRNKREGNFDVSKCEIGAGRFRGTNVGHRPNPRAAGVANLLNVPKINIFFFFVP